VAEAEVEADIPEPVAARPSHGSGRRGDTDPAHRRLFGLLPSFLSSGIDEERLAESRAADTSAAQISPSPALASPDPETSALPSGKLRKLRDTLRELQECRRLLDVAMANVAT